MGWPAFHRCSSCSRYAGDGRSDTQYFRSLTVTELVISWAIASGRSVMARI